jgi:hypothetical protein
MQEGDHPLPGYFREKRAIFARRSADAQEAKETFTRCVRRLALDRLTVAAPLRSFPQRAPDFVRKKARAPCWGRTILRQHRCHARNDPSDQCSAGFRAPSSVRGIPFFFSDYCAGSEFVRLGMPSGGRENHQWIGDVISAGGCGGSHIASWLDGGLGALER